MFVMWNKISEDKTLGIAENIWAGIYTNLRLPGVRMWCTHEMPDILLTSLTEVCHAAGSESVSC